VTRKLTPAADAEIAEALAIRRKFTLKRLRERFRVDKATLYRAAQRARRRQRDILVTSVR
jgi:hypothetical protein